jgi:hypothetical protein
MVNGLVFKSLMRLIANLAKGVARRKNRFRGTKQVDIGLHAMLGLVDEGRAMGKSFEHEVLHSLSCQRIRQLQVDGLNAFVAFRVIADIPVDSRSNPRREIIPTNPAQGDR